MSYRSVILSKGIRRRAMRLFLARPAVTVAILTIAALCQGHAANALQSAVSWPPQTGKLHIVIDTDAANEVDDQWAIALALGFPERLQIEGFVAAHYGLRGNAQGIEKSYEKILEVLAAAHMSDRFPVKRGSDPIVYTDRISESEGVSFILEKAKQATPQNPLWIVALGPATDAASALLKDPSIADRVVILWHGRTEWPLRCWNFNASNDLKAVQILFDRPLRFVLFDTGAGLNMPMEESERRIGSNGTLGRYLHDIRKKSAYASLPTKGFFDVGDIAALLDERLITSEITRKPTVADDYKYIFDGRTTLFTRITDVQREPTFRLLDEALTRIALAAKQ